MYALTCEPLVFGLAYYYYSYCLICLTKGGKKWGKGDKGPLANVIVLKFNQ